MEDACPFRAAIGAASAYPDHQPSSATSGSGAPHRSLCSRGCFLQGVTVHHGDEEKEGHYDKRPVIPTLSKAQ